jgi:hypothetical protein
LSAQLVRVARLTDEARVVLGPPREDANLARRGERESGGAGGRGRKRERARKRWKRGGREGGESPARESWWGVRVAST